MLKGISQKIIDHVTFFAKKREILIGIDPSSTLGKDILRQNREIIVVKNEVLELKKMLTTLEQKLSVQSIFVNLSIVTDDPEELKKRILSELPKTTLH